VVNSLKWAALGSSVRGASHEQKNLPNQDAIRLHNPAGKDDFLIMAVADGHGSTRSFRSEKGSGLAAECAVKVLGNFVRRLGPDVPLSQVRHQARTRWPRAIVSAWRSAVRADLAETPFAALDFAAFPEAPPVFKPGADLPPVAYLAYGATLLTVAITRRYVIFSQLGDGDILAIRENGVVSRPLPKQHEFMSNQTVSLCTHNAALRFQTRVEPCRSGGPVLVMLSTDGYANCFGTEESFFTVGADILKYLKSHGVAFVGEMLEQWLRESSQDGSGDDITVGLAVRSIV